VLCSDALNANESRQVYLDLRAEGQSAAVWRMLSKRVDGKQNLPRTWGDKPVNDSIGDVASPRIKSIGTARFRAGLSWLAIVCMLLLMSVPNRAQTTTADVVGTVTDGSGAALTGARVTVENLATHGTHI